MPISPEEQHLLPKKTFIVTLPNGNIRVVIAHQAEFAGEMNSCLWFFNYLPDYNHELIHAFSANAWSELYEEKSDAQDT